MNTPRCLFGLEWIPDGRLFAVGGYGGDREPTASVEMLECSWEARDGPATSKWRYVAPLLGARVKHGVCFFAGKLLAVGGENAATVECFTLPSAGNEVGEWTRIRPLNQDNTLVGVLSFREGLLCVGKCVISLQMASILIGLGYLNKPVIALLAKLPGEAYGCCTTPLNTMGKSAHKPLF